MASQRGRARFAEKPRGGFVFGSSTPRELSYVRGAPTTTRSADASSNGSPSAGNSDKQHNLSYYMRQARSITPGCGDRNKSWAFGSSTPRQFSHLNSMKPELRVYDVKIQTKSARSHTAPSINDRPPKAPTATPKPRPPPAPVQKKAPKNDDADSISSEPDFRDHRPTFSKPPAGKKPNGTSKTSPSKGPPPSKVTSSTTVRKISGTTKTPTSATKTTTVRKTTTTTTVLPMTKKTSAVVATSPVGKKISLTEKKASPEKRKESAVERFAPPLPMATEQEHMVPKAVHTNQEYEAAVSSVPSATMHNDISEVMQEDSNIEVMMEQKPIAQNQSGNFAGVASNVAEKINEVLNLANQSAEDDVEEKFEEKNVSGKEPQVASLKNDDLLAGIGGFISSVSEKIRDVVHDAEVKEMVPHGAPPGDTEAEGVVVKHDFEKKEEGIAAEKPKTLLESANDLLGEDVVEKAIGYVQSLKHEPLIPGEKDVVDEELFEQKIVNPQHGEFAPLSEIEKPTDDSTDSAKSPARNSDEMAREVNEAGQFLGDTSSAKSTAFEEVEKAFDEVSEAARSAVDPANKEAEKLSSFALESERNVLDSAENPIASADELHKGSDPTIHRINEGANTVVLGVESAFDKMGKMFDSTAEKAADTVTEGLTNLANQSMEKVDQIGGNVKSMKDDFSEFVKDSSEKFAEGFDSAKDAVTTKAANVADVTKNVVTDAKDTVTKTFEEIVDFGKSGEDFIGSAASHELEETKNGVDFAGRMSTKDDAAEDAGQFADNAVDLTKSAKDTVADGVNSVVGDVSEGAEIAAAAPQEVLVSQVADAVAGGAEKAADVLVDSGTKVADFLSKGVEGAVSSVSIVIDKVADTTTEGAHAADPMSQGYSDTVEGTGHRIVDADETAGDDHKDVAEFIAHSAEKSADTVTEQAPKTVDAVPQGYKDTVEGAGKVVDVAGEGGHNTAESYMHGVADTVTEAVHNAADTVADGATKFADSVSTRHDEISSGAQNLFGEVKGKVSETTKGAEKTASSIGSKISSFFGGKD